MTVPLWSTSRRFHAADISCLVGDRWLCVVLSSTVTLSAAKNFAHSEGVISLLLSSSILSNFSSSALRSVSASSPICTRICWPVVSTAVFAKALISMPLFLFSSTVRVYSKISQDWCRGELFESLRFESLRTSIFVTAGQAMRSASVPSGEMRR